MIISVEEPWKNLVKPNFINKNQRPQLGWRLFGSAPGHYVSFLCGTLERWLLVTRASFPDSGRTDQSAKRISSDQQGTNQLGRRISSDSQWTNQSAKRISSDQQQTDQSAKRIWTDQQYTGQLGRRISSDQQGTDQSAKRISSEQQQTDADCISRELTDHLPSVQTPDVNFNTFHWMIRQIKRIDQTRKLQRWLYVSSFACLSVCVAPTHT